jgi:hypothetical protein
MRMDQNRAFARYVQESPAQKEWAPPAGADIFMTIAVDEKLTRAMPTRLVIILIPLAFALIGIALRYAAFAAINADSTFLGFVSGMCRWDCGWYVTLAQKGYDPFPIPSMINAGNWAFFPLYPMFVGVLRIVTGLPTMLVATIASITLTWAAVVIAWPLFHNNFRAYVLYSAFLLAGPFSIYFTTFYTEVMFLLWITCVFVALQQRNYLAAGLFAALLSATRIVGVFIVFAIVLQVWLDHRKDGGTFKSFVTGIWTRTDVLLAIFIAPLGLFGYMAYLHYQVGDALAFQHTQRAWGRPMGNPAFYVWQGLTRFPTTGWIPTVSQQLAFTAVTGLVMSVVLAIRKQYGAALFCAICLTLPLFAGLASVLRFTVGLAPISILAMVLLSRWRWSFWAGLALILVTDYLFVAGWLGGYLTLV